MKPVIVIGVKPVEIKSFSSYSYSQCKDTEHINPHDSHLSVCCVLKVKSLCFFSMQHCFCVFGGQNKILSTAANKNQSQVDATKSPFQSPLVASSAWHQVISGGRCWDDERLRRSDRWHFCVCILLLSSSPITWLLQIEHMSIQLYAVKLASKWYLANERMWQHISSLMY